MSTCKWDRHFLGLALAHARMSKDPNTKVGAIIVGPDRELISAGFNGFPRGIEDSDERLTNRDLKLKLIVHAEMNAVLAAARHGIQLKGMHSVSRSNKRGNRFGVGRTTMYSLHCRNHAGRDYRNCKPSCD